MTPHFHQIHTMLSAWSQYTEPSGGPTGAAGIMPRGRDRRDRAGDYRGHQKTVVCNKGLHGVDCWGWLQTASFRGGRRVRARK